MEAFAFEIQQVGGSQEAFLHFQGFRVFARRRDGRFRRKLPDGDFRNLISSFQKGGYAGFRATNGCIGEEQELLQIRRADDARREGRHAGRAAAFAMTVANDVAT